MSWRPGRRYSDDLRGRVLAAVDRGLPVYEAAPVFGVSVSYVYKALGRRRATGLETSLPARGRPGRKLAPHFDALGAEVAARPDATLVELVAWAERTLGIKVCPATMWAALEALGLTLKKRRVTPPSGSVPMSPPRARLGARAKGA